MICGNIYIDSKLFVKLQETKDKVTDKFVNRNIVETATVRDISEALPETYEALPETGAGSMLPGHKSDTLF
jgi:hypothetical protein